MTTDFENELRDLFREKAGEAPLATPTMPASAPQQVLRRGRLHQVGTVLGSAVVVVALIVGSVAGLTRILGEGQDDRVGSELRGLPTNCDDRGIHRGEPLGLVPGQRVADVDGDRRPGQRRDRVRLHARARRSESGVREPSRRRDDVADPRSARSPDAPALERRPRPDRERVRRREFPQTPPFSTSRSITSCDRGRRGSGRRRISTGRVPVSRRDRGRTLRPRLATPSSR